MTHIKLLIGPHHGEYDFESLSYGYSDHYRWTFKDLGYVDNDDDDTDDEHYIKTKDLIPYLKTHKHLLDNDDKDWGNYTTLTINFKQEGHITEEWMMDSLIRKLKDQYLTAYITCGGDDGTFDYMPSFTECLEQVFELLDRKNEIKPIRNICYQTTDNLKDAEGMEFFTDEELQEFETLRPKKS